MRLDVLKNIILKENLHPPLLENDDVSLKMVGLSWGETFLSLFSLLVQAAFSDFITMCLAHLSEHIWINLLLVI